MIVVVADGSPDRAPTPSDVGLALALARGVVDGGVGEPLEQRILSGGAVDGEEVLYPINQEIITVRYRQAGEYIVNLYFYEQASGEPVPVEVKVDRVNPTLTTVFAETFELVAQDQELTALRFSIDREGNVFDINSLPLRLTPYGLDRMPSWVD